MVSLSCHCNDCNTGLYILRKDSAVCGAYASHTWIKLNRTVPAPTYNNIVTTQQSLSQPSSIPAQLMLIQIIMDAIDIAQQCIMLIAIFVSLQFHTQLILRPNRGIYICIDSQQRQQPLPW